MQRFKQFAAGGFLVYLLCGQIVVVPQERPKDIVVIKAPAKPDLNLDFNVNIILRHMTGTPRGSMYITMPILPVSAHEALFNVMNYGDLA